MKGYHILALALLILLIFAGTASAQSNEGLDINQTSDELAVSIDLNTSKTNHVSLEATNNDIVTEGESSEITVENWDDLQYYCSLDDKDYTLKLKENTNYYPTNVSDSNYQINIKNNVHIIGAEGAYIGDVLPDAGKITYTAIKVDDDNGIGVTLENITFKWIATRYQPDGVFFVMGGNANNIIRNCYFTNITTDLGHSSILHLKRGYATLSNCTFVNCTTDFGCVSIYDPADDPTKTCTGASMNVDDCYFEGNYAKTEPGCINNCGILVVNNSTFYKNSAFWWAGAIHTHGGANTTIYDSDFFDNLAGWNGGALYTYSYLQIYGSRFIGNNCTTNNGGGAIGACKYLHAPYIHIEDTLFENNENLCWGLDELSTSGTGRGGAISLMDEGGLEVYNSVFIKNSASIGTAICAINGGLSYGSPDVKLIGNQFINHTRVGDVLDVRLATGSVAEIRDNYFLNNSIVFSKLKLTADDPTSDGKVTFHLDAALKNPKSYDEDILQKSKYDVYVNGVYKTTVSSTDFTLDLGKGNTARVYVVPSISTSKSNEVFAGIPKTYIYVSQSRGNDNNDGSTRAKPVKTLNKSIELARSSENIVIMDGTFKETDLLIDYNLTIVAENNVAISATGNIFTITDGDVRFENLTFKNCKYGSSTKNRIISQTSTGFLTLDGCVFESNEFRTQVEASGNLECENIVATNNKDGSIFKADSIVIKSSLFTNNIATYTGAKSIIMYKTNSKMTKFEAENLTFIGNTVYSGCLLPAKAKATITDCTFIGNIATSSGKASAISVENSGSVLIQSCKFINNTDTGKYASVIYATSGTVVLQDSILINNSYENTNNLVINGIEAQLKKLTANNNWWGNTPDNLTKPALKVFPKSNNLPNGWDPASYLLVLNGTAISNDIELFNKVPVQFIFTQIDNEGNVTAYDGGFMPSIDLTLKAVNGTCSDNKITMVNGMATTFFTLTEMSGGSLTASFNGIDSTIYFSFKKSTPEMTITANNISVGNAAEIGVTLDTGVNGNVILKVGNVTQTKPVYTSATFTILDLPAGNYTVEANYTGNDRYESVVSTAKLSVNKLPSDINISYGAVALNSDVVFTFSLENGATGTIEVYLNGNKKQTINVGQTYTITKISRGDYSLKAVYSGDSRYLASEDEVKLEVAKLTPAVTADIPEVTYGSDTIVSVTLNSDTTGNVTVTVDGKSNSSAVNGGKASVTFSNLNAGTNKNAVITYSGDNNYKNSTITKSFNVKKAKLDFTITSNNIKVGQDAIVQITLPARIGGTVTLSGIKTKVVNVPVTGIVTEHYADLADGTYTVTARYDGDNYETASKSTSFKVSLWDVPQWANEGGDVKHTGKSPYDTAANGDLKWSSEVGEITGNMAIDSQGNVYVTTNEGIYSLDANGNLRWKYLSNDAGSTFAGIAISRDVIIAPKADDTIYFINQTTGERYGHANLFQGSSNFAPIVDENGNVYTSGQGGEGNNPNLVIIPYKIWENGGAPTVIALGSSPNGAPVLINDNLVAVPCNTSLIIVDVSSKSVIATISGNTNDSYAVVGEGNVIYTFLGDSISAINSVGTNRWSTKVTGGIGNKLTLDPEQAVYSVNAGGELYKYDLLDGSESKFTNLTVTSGILVGSDSNVYFASNEFVYALDVDGNVLWKAKLDSGIVGTPIMDKNGIIYVNSLNKVYALKQASLRDAGLLITTKTINVDETETITITLNENATGFIDLTINGNASKEEVIDGRIVKTFDNLNAGDYKVTVKYSGDLRYLQTTKSDNFGVLKLIPQMGVTANNIKYGDDAVFDVVLPAVAEGTVTVNVNGKSNSSKLNNGNATISISGLTKGDYNYTVSYSGDSYYNSTAKTSVISVGKDDFAFNVAEIKDVKVDSPVEFFITNVPSDASGSFEVSVDGIKNRTSPNNGQTKLVINGLKVGNYTAEIVYFDDNNYMADSKNIQFKVIKKDVSFTVTVNAINVGDVANFIISGLPDDAKGNVIVVVDDINQSGNGQTSINVANLTYGPKNATITFEGDDKYNSKTLIKEFKVNKVDPSFTVDDIDDKFVSDKVEFGAYLNPDADGNISVAINGNYPEEFRVTDGKANLVITSLTYGNKTVIVTYSGNEKYLAKTITKTFAVDKIKPDLIVDNPSKINVGDNITFTVKLPNGATGDVNVTIGDVTETVKAKSSLEISISNLTEGVKKAIITYSGDSKYYSNSISKEFEVVKNTLNIVAIVEDTKYGNPTKFVVNLNPDASGTISVKIDGKTASAKIINGSATVEINGLSLGSKTAEISYSGDNRYDSAKITKPFTITDTDKVNANIDASVSDINVGESAVFTVNLNSDASGIVTVSVDGISASGTLSNGKATVNINGLSSGHKTALIAYDGDSKYKSTIISRDFKVNKIAPTADAKVNDINVGDNAEIEITLNSDVSGNVTVRVDEKSYSSIISNGKAKIIIPNLTYGKKTVIVSYSGDNKYLQTSISKEFNVNKIKPTVSVKSENINVGEIAVFTITLNSDASGIVSVNVDGKYNSNNLVGGSAKLSIANLTSGNKKATINYMGNDKYLSANVTCDVSVNRIKPVIGADVKDISVGDNAVMDITLNSDASGVINVIVDGKTTTADVLNGKAKVVLTDLSSGVKSASISYSGDEKYSDSSITKSFKVNKLTPVISASADDINAGEKAVFIISLNQDATGTVSVNIGGKTYSSKLTEGATKISVEGLTCGIKEAIINYEGDGKYLSANTSCDVHVNKLKSQILIKVGDDDVTVSIPGATGNVFVIVDVSEIAVPLVNGSVKVPLANLSAGNHSVVALYMGDETHSPAHGASTFSVGEDVAVNPAATQFVNITIFNDSRVSAVLADENGVPIAGAKIAYAVGSKSGSALTDTNGLFTINGESGVLMTVNYAGDDKYLATNTTIKFDNVASGVKQSTNVLGDDFTQYACDFYGGERGGHFTFRLVDAKGKPIAKKTIFIGYNGVTLNRTTDANGFASVQINLMSSGLYTFVIVFLGDDDYTASMAVHKVTINKKPVTISASAKAFKATAKTKKYTVTLKTIQGSSADGKTYFAAGKKVTLDVAGKTYSAKVDVNGKATFNLKLAKKVIMLPKLISLKMQPTGLQANL
ncbi:MAG: Ig-like domain repeat protein [Methanobrevibacter sp.]|nr:Ig-like domain repeat protein [Methanobrevibacter sp.]